MVDRLDLDAYVSMISDLNSAGYVFSKFSDEITVNDPPCVLLRHDVDFSLSKALELARIEANLGLQSTYFIQVGAPSYNALSIRSANIVSEIISCGHTISLHFDFLRYSANISRGLVLELETLRIHYSCADTSVVSLHRPGLYSGTLSDLLLTGGMSHTYEDRFVRDFTYFSDSGGCWREGNPVTSLAFEARRSMQILVHPLWWLTQGESPTEKISRHIQESAIETAEQMEETTVSFSLESVRDQLSSNLKPRCQWC